MNAKEYVDEVLAALGITNHYLGRDIASELICMALAAPDRLRNIRQELYIPLAEKRGCTWQQIDRNLRTVILRAWSVNSSALRRLAHYPLRVSPTAGEFLEIIMTHVHRREKLRKPAAQKEEHPL